MRSVKKSRPLSVSTTTPSTTNVFGNEYEVLSMEYLTLTGEIKNTKSIEELNALNDKIEKVSLRMEEIRKEYLER